LGHDPMAVLPTHMSHVVPTVCPCVCPRCPRGRCPPPLSPWSRVEPATVYLCPQSLIKLHPKFLDVLARVVLGDPCGRLVLLQHRTSESTDAVVARVMADALAAAAGWTRRSTLFNATHTPPAHMCTTLSALATALDRVTLTETRPFDLFQELLATADVAIDPHPFGECQ
jgi:hypothetical protein